MTELGEPNIKVRKILFTVVLAVIGVGMISLGYWVGEPLGRRVSDFSDFMVRSKLSGGLKGFGFAFILVACVVNINPKSRLYRRMRGRE